MVVSAPVSPDCFIVVVPPFALGALGLLASHVLDRPLHNLRPFRELRNAIVVRAVEVLDVEHLQAS